LEVLLQDTSFQTNHASAIFYTFVFVGHLQLLKQVNSETSPKLNGDSQTVKTISLTKPKETSPKLNGDNPTVKTMSLTKPKGF